MDRQIALNSTVQLCSDALNVDTGRKVFTERSDQENTYERPVGHTITVDNEPFRSPEMLSWPSFFGKEVSGGHEATSQDIISEFVLAGPLETHGCLSHKHSNLAPHSPLIPTQFSLPTRFPTPPSVSPYTHTQHPNIREYEEEEEEDAHPYRTSPLYAGLGVRDTGSGGDFPIRSTGACSESFPRRRPLRY